MNNQICFTCGKDTDGMKLRIPYIGKGLFFSSFKWIDFPICNQCLKEYNQNIFTKRMKEAFEMNKKIKEFAKTLPMQPPDSNLPLVP